MLTCLRSEFGGDDPVQVSRIVSTAELISAFTDGRAKLSLKEAKQRLQGFAIGPEGTCMLLLTVTEQGLMHRRSILQRIETCAIDSGLEKNDLKLAGVVYQTLAIDIASETALRWYLLPSMLAAVLVAWRCLGQFRYTINVFVIAGVGQIISVALIKLCGSELSAVLIVLPTLIFMLTLSGAVHLTNYYRDLGGDENPEAGIRALRMGVIPCSLATITTVMGFGSLAVSQLQPVREFGIYAGVSLALSTLVLFFIFPALYAFGRGTSQQPLNAPGVGLLGETSVDARDVTALTQHGHSRRWTVVASGFIQKYREWISWLGILLLCLTLTGISQLKSTTRFEHMFPAQSRQIQNLMWVEKQIGPVSAIEVLLKFQTGEPSDPYTRAQIANRIHQTLLNSPEVGGVLSPISVLPALPQSRSLGDNIRRTAIRRFLTDHMDLLIEQKLVADLEQTQFWRFTARVSELQDDKYSLLIDRIRARCDQTLSEIHQDQPRSIQLEYTGLTSVIGQAHDLLLDDLGISFVSAFLMITPVMMIIVRGFFAGFLVMIPNLLPVTLVFGGMGWLDVKLDIASILTASVALGIAVDDTLHFMNWFILSRTSGQTKLGAVRRAMQECAPSMLHTTMISCSAMLPFFFSEFSPTSKFALLMILILIGAIVGDLLLLPALLLSRLGNVVSVRRFKHQSDPHLEQTPCSESPTGPSRP